MTILQYESDELAFCLKNFELEFLTPSEKFLNSRIPWVFLYNEQTLKLRLLVGEPSVSVSYSQKEIEFTIQFDKYTKSINCDMFSTLITQGVFFDLLKSYCSIKESALRLQKDLQ